MTQYPDIFAALAAPFRDDEVKVLPKAGGKPYITARTGMNRLDEVLGPEGWWDSYIPLKNSVICALSIRLPDGQVLTKMDAGARSQTGDDGVDDMGAHSDAFKRAGVKFGIARYLYGDGVPPFVMDPAEAKRRGILLHKVGTGLHSAVEMEPASLRESPASRGTAPAPPRSPNAIPVGQQPTTGKALWAWAERIGTATGANVIDMIVRWGKDRGQSRVVDWDVALVSECFADMAAKLDEKGLIEIPQEARSQMPVRSSDSAPAKDAGPLTIHPKDLLLKEKLRAVAIVKELSARVLGKGQVPTEAQAMAWLDAQVVTMGYPAIRDLRKYANKSNLLVIVSQLEILLSDSNQVS